MKVSRDESNELLELLGAAWDERLDEVAFARLEELLARNPAAYCDVLVAFSRLQVELALLAASSQAHERALSLLAPHFAESTRNSAPASPASVRKRKTSSALPPTNFLRAGLRNRSFAAIAAGLLVSLVAVTWYSLGNHSQTYKTTVRLPLLRTPHKVARFASAEGAVWQNDASYRPGDLLAKGERLHLVRGAAQLSMVCGADVLLQSPCAVELSSESFVRLERGTLTAQVAKWAKGFVVEAEGLRVTDLGTRFAVMADSPGLAEVHVLEGVVRAEPVSARAGTIAPLLVTAGQAVQWNQEQARLERRGVESSRFIGVLPRFRPLRRIDIANTGRGAAIGSRDTRWRIPAGHPSGGTFPSQAIVGLPHLFYLDNASNQSQWISVLGGMSRGVAPYTSYTFETTFDLAKVDPATVHLVGQFLVDNRVQEIRLNGKSVGVQPWELFNREDFQKFHVVEVRTGFVSGVNRIEIDVVNGTVQDGSYNPMALRVEWQAFGCAVGG